MLAGPDDEVKEDPFFASNHSHLGKQKICQVNLKYLSLSLTDEDCTYLSLHVLLRFV